MRELFKIEVEVLNETTTRACQCLCSGLGGGAGGEK
jgi:hypothetical protein